ncbi:MAG: serine/threonine-protein kinase [Pyrinomonadaceae bacterium]
MALLAVKITMLYCPKCQHTYETGSQRFCSNDGVRLLLAPSPGRAGAQTGGVFSSLLGRTESNTESNANAAAMPKFVQFEQSQPSIPEFIQPEITKDFKKEPVFEPEADDLLELEEKDLSKEVPSAKPQARIIRPSEIPSGTADVGDRKANPTGRLALTWEQPKILLGQMVKGRYYVVEMLGKDEVSISYLAEDKIIQNKRTFVRVFMDEDTGDSLSNKIFAEERVSLSHINHPNIASVIDSGELPEGKPFIISEYVDGKTVKDMLDRTGQFNALRSGRIIRQASYALSEAHQNGILHRNLKPENIFLTISESGAEQVKLTNFGVLYDKINEGNIGYKSPEQIEGKLSNYASDIYSLAVIAYQMLTNRMPFNVSTGNALLKAQRGGLTLVPTNFRLDVSPLVDDILEKALSFNPSDRYPKARDFGDALFNALSTISPWEKPETSEKIEILPAASEPEEEVLELEPAISNFESEEEAELDLTAEPEIELEQPDLLSEDSPVETEEPAAITQAEPLKETEGLPWEKRSPDAAKMASPNWLLFLISALGLVVFLGVWYYFLNRPNVPVFVPAQTPTNQNMENPPGQNANTALPNAMPSTTEINEIPPNPRDVQQPPNTIYFENSKQNLSGEIVKSFLGFSIYYPKDWIKASSENNFLNISKNSPDGLPIKSVIITRYASDGTFSKDRAAFPGLRKKSENDLKQILPVNYLETFAEETTIQDGRWKAYEVRFQGGTDESAENKMIIRGRRFWIPIQRPGMKNGFVITMLATSLAPDIFSVDDVVKDSELSQILDTFEPAQNK